MAKQLVAGEAPSEDLIQEKNKKFNFYNNLFCDIEFYGILNPVLAHSGFAPKFFLKFVNGREIIVTHGNSRLWVAKQLGCIVPFILIDWHGDMNEYEQVCSHTQFDSYFRTPPRWVNIDKTGLTYGPLGEVQQDAERQWRK